MCSHVLHVLTHMCTHYGTLLDMDTQEGEGKEGRGRKTRYRLRRDKEKIPQR